MGDSKGPKKVTTSAIKEAKISGKKEKLVMITAYDYTFARLIDELVDIVLVGDSLGMVIQGHPNTLSVTMDDMVYHSKSVARGLSHAHLVVDMPFMSYQPSLTDAIKNAGRLLQEGMAESVKLEGGVSIAPTVSKLVELGIPVLGHIGLTPQSVHAFGGYKVQGRTDTSRSSIMDDALSLEDAGAYALVLEGIPWQLAKSITERIDIPTIGIGAGQFCDGQVLVNQDMLGMNPSFNPRFVKRYANLGEQIKDAVKTYAIDVQKGLFPGDQHSFT